MVWNDWGWRKRAVLVGFLFVFTAVAVIAVLMERSVSEQKFSGSQPVRVVETASFSTAPTKLRAQVEGSIYENGSNMTVYGACLDGDMYLLPGATAHFTAWYPNGSVMVGPDENMTRIYDDFAGFHPNGTGRWKVYITMGDFIGTYLTEVRCVLGSEYATAIGEWQNPEWVVKIGQTYNNVLGINGSLTQISQQVTNLSTDVSNFRSEVQVNFSTVLAEINSISVNTTISDLDKVARLNQLYNALREQYGGMWVIDDTNPSYSLGSGMNNWVSVDMVDRNAVYMVSSDGAYQYWDGENWFYTNFSGVSWHDVKAIDMGSGYVWLVGQNDSGSVYSINGGPLASFPGSGSQLLSVDIMLRPDDPAGVPRIFVLDNYALYLSEDYGVSWTELITIDSGSIWGHLQAFQQDNQNTLMSDEYNLLLLDGAGEVMFYNGSEWSFNTTYGIQNLMSGDVLNKDSVRIVVWDYNQDQQNQVWDFNGTDVVVQYAWQNATMGIGDTAIPSGVQIHSDDDIWVATRVPSVFLHFDGERWEYKDYRLSNGSFVSIIFGSGSEDPYNGTGIYDLSMSDPFSGYAVGSDGIVLKYQSHDDFMLGKLLENLTAQLQALQVDVNLTQVLDNIQEVNQTVNSIYSEVIGINLTQQQQTELLQQINQTVYNNSVNLSYIAGIVDATYAAVLSLNMSVFGNLTAILDKMDQMNQSIQVRLDAIEGNTTYTNIYLSGTIYPLLNSTYQNTLLILQRLGVIEANVNSTLQISNQTLQLVNQTLAIVNNSQQARPVKAWTTP